MALKNFLSALILIPFCLLGQNNQTVKEVVTVKRVITNNGQNITISEQQSTQQIKGTVVVAGDSIVNQSATERSIRINDTINAQDQRIKDSVNQAKVAALKAAREAELKASIEAQKAKAEAQKKALEAQYKKQIEALEAQRKALMKKPDNK
jgi:cell division septation protein DedD